LLAGGTQQNQKGMILCNPFFFLLVDSVLGSALGAWACVPLAAPVPPAADDDCAVEVPAWDAVEVDVAGATAEVETTAAPAGAAEFAGDDDSASGAAAGAGASTAAGPAAAGAGVALPAPGASRI